MKLDLKYINFVIVIFCLITLSICFSNQLFKLFDRLFNLPYLNYYAGLFSAVFILTKKVKTSQIKFSRDLSFNQFRVPVEEILSFLGNPITLVCSISLARGLYKQRFTNEEYFQNFESWELWFITMVTFYLLLLSFLELINNIKATIFKSIKTVTVKGESNENITNEVPNPEH